MNGQRQKMMSIPPKILQSVVCCSCKKSFYEKCNLSIRSKNPYLLNCGHSICESCCLTVSHNVVSCGTCGSQTQITSEKTTSIDLPRNAYLVGRLYTENKLSSIDYVSFKIAMKSKSVSSANIVDVNYLEGNFLGSCYECSIADATLSCQQCDCNYCSSCWDLIHSSGKSLKKHVLQTNNSFSVKTVESCKVHRDSIIEFYCRECKLYACPNCIVINHQGGNHKLITLQERNSELFKVFEYLKNEVSLNMKRMSDASADLKTLKKSQRNESLFDDLKRLIFHNFLHLHGLLQVLEQSAIEKLEAAENVKRDHLEKLILQLDGQIETTQTFLRRVENLNNPEQLHRDFLFERILDALITLKNLPSQLVTSKDLGMDMSNENPTVSFDETVIQSIQNYCNLEVSMDYFLELKNDNIDDNVFDLFNLSKANNNLESRSELINEIDILSVLSKNSEFSYAAGNVTKQQSLNMLPKRKSVDMVEGNAYPVFITYVKDPGEFFVMRSSLRKKRQKINSQSCNIQLTSEVQEQPKFVRRDEYYLVQYTVDDKWYRGKVVDVLSDKDENDEMIAIIYFLDYGNQQEVPLSRLRVMPKALSAEPPLAVKCKLFGCVPVNGTWCKGSTKVMLEILEKSLMTIYVMKAHADYLEVDLCKRGNDESSDNELNSLRDMMIFLEYASYSPGCDSRRKKRLHNSYLTPDLPNTTNFRGIITYVESASLFYIQKIGPDTQYLMSLMDKMDITCNKENEKGLIYNPELGMPCAALYPQDGKWYRGEITDLPGNERITVHYVDYGNTEIIHWKSVKNLQAEFLKLVPQAIPCSLSRQRNKKWRQNVKECLEKFSLEILRIVVDNREDKKLNVTLYTSKGLCVNDGMLEGGVFTVKNIAQDFCKAFDDSVECETFDSERNLISVNEQKMEILKYGEKLGNSDEVFRMKVKVLQVSSPSDIYISPSCFLSREEQLESELQEFYTKSSIKNMEKWEVKNKCAVLSCKRDKWYRGTIIEILNNGKIKVLLNDIMETEDVPVSNIRLLDKRFFAYPVGAIKCHLSGIFPPEVDWPGLTCDFLQSQLELYDNVYVTKMGEIVNDSLPVQLSVKNHIQGGALEPSTEEWIVLNDLIVAQGLAVPEKAKLIQHVICDNEIKPNNCNVEKTSKVKDVYSPDVTKKVDNNYIFSITCDWLPPTICQKDRFIGEPTYIDSNGVLYIHDEEDKPIMEKIHTSLLNYYKDSIPEAHDQNWSVGQLCIVKYHLDGGWYRGKVLQINEDCTYKVLFIDYGNTEMCRVTEMRKDVTALEIPTLAKRFVLYGISPVSDDGRWPSRVIDYIYSSIVEKRCDVTVVKKAKDPFQPNMIRLVQLEDGIDLNEDLVNVGLAEFILDDESKKMKYWHEDCVAVSQIGSEISYSQLELQEEFKSYPIKVLAVNYSDFIVHILDHDLVPEQIRRIISDFVSLTDEIQTVAEFQKKIEDFREGIPCISLYWRNGTWCRAQILRLDVDQDLILVRFVDYGNEEYVSKNKIRKILKKWLKVHTMALTFQLYNVRMCEGVRKSDYMERLFKCLSRSELTAEIIERKENFYLVEVKRNGVLAYQEMIDDGLMEEVNKSEIIDTIMDETINNS